MKTLNLGTDQITFETPNTIAFANSFDEEMYEHLYTHITDQGIYKPIIDTDSFYDTPAVFDVKALFESVPLALPKRPTARASNRDRLYIKFIVRDFISRHPKSLGLFTNSVPLANSCIENAEILLGKTVDVTNFIEIKSVIDQINRTAWNRVRDTSETQSGKSTLGTISETLLERVFGHQLDGTTFFKNNNNSVKSYGDFVLVCLPNNLWLSVKSNFARERLLASGYANDILGVGFFQSAKEFTSRVRVRNLQRAGFLAMYCPDVPISKTQIKNNTNTYDQVIDYYQNHGGTAPCNINGKPFIRKLSNLPSDLQTLLGETSVRKRTTVNF
jgi:hypothetical protein